jgi:hypothetical protein
MKAIVLEVDFSRIVGGEPARLGTIRWDSLHFTIDPPHRADLAIILGEPVRVPIKGLDVRAVENPRLWMENLYLCYRNAYFGVTPAREL